MGAVLAVGGAAVTPAPGHAATSEEIMAWCKEARYINGKKQEFTDSMLDSPSADSCDYRQVGELEIYEGVTEKVTPDFPNCDPDATEMKASVSWTFTVGQRAGHYLGIDQGGTGGLFGVLNGSWMKHTGSLDLTIKEGTVADSSIYDVPPGKVLYIEFTPKLQRMNGEWQVVRGPDLYTAPDATQGPHMLKNPTEPDKTGAVDGRVEAIYEDC